jgi:tRNA A-37 threonylcarbamoyl transferase component Bud32
VARTRIQRLAPAEQPRREAWLAALTEFDPSGATRLKQDAGTAVYRARLMGRDVVVKSWQVRGPLSRLKALVRHSRADRHWRGAGWLTAQGIPTAPVLVLASAGNRQILVMEALPGKTVLQHLADRDLMPRQEHAVAAALGRQIAALMARGRSNHDPKPSNQIVTGVSGEIATVALIDCVAVRPIVWFDSEEPIPMLAKLLIEAIGCGVPPRRALRMRALRAYWDALGHLRPASATPFTRAARNHAWMEVAAFITNHGDPTPLVPPLPAVQASPAPPR